MDDVMRAQTNVVGPVGPSTWLQSLPWLAGIILLASVTLGIWGYARDHAIDAAVHRDSAIVIATERVLSSLKDVETGQRGFVITGKDEYLEPYEAGRAAVASDLDTVEAMLGEEGGPLADLVRTRLQEAAQGIDTYRLGGAAAGAARVQSGRGKAAMDRVRVEVARLQKGSNDRIAAAQSSRSLDDILRATLSSASYCRAPLSRTPPFAAAASIAPARRCSMACSRTLRSASVSSTDRFACATSTKRWPVMGEKALGVAPGVSIWDVLPQLRVSLEPRIAQVVEGRRTVAKVDVEALASFTRERSGITRRRSIRCAVPRRPVPTTGSVW